MVSACRGFLASGTSSYLLLLVLVLDEGLWSVVGGAVCAPSKDRWETRLRVFHGSGTIHRLVSVIAFMPSPWVRAAYQGLASSVLSA